MKLIQTLTILCACSLMAQSYCIKGPANPKPQEQTAIQELTVYLAKRIDGTLSIGGKSPVTFQVGDTELAKQHKLLSTDLLDEEWRIKSIGDKIILNGGGTRGVLYATYHFLEDYCGIHWWTDIEEYIPKASPLTLDKLDASGRPKFLQREIYRPRPSNPAIAIRNRLNANGATPVPKEYGGSFCFGPPSACHTFDNYVPAAKYLKEHPEYFSLVKGKRVGGQSIGQLCLTNPDIKRIVVENLLEQIAKGEADAAKAGVPAPRVYDVSMNDNHNRCQCDACKAEEAKYNPSGLYLNFVNAIAAEVKKTHPNIYIGTLAYFFTEEPPKGGVRAAENVVVRLCDTGSNGAASILAPENRRFRELVQSWKDVAANLFIWDYAILYTPSTNGLPFPSEFTYSEQYKFYYENNVKGIFWEHQEVYRSDFNELKYFLEAKLLEEPYLDVEKLTEEFMTCYFGPAAKLMLEYRKAVNSLRKERNGFISWKPQVENFSFIDNNDIIRFQELFDKSETAVAGDKRLLARVRHARCGLDRLACSRGTSPVRHKADEAFAFMADKETADKMNVAIAANRQLEAWPAWCRQFRGGTQLARDMRSMILPYSLTKESYDVPEQFLSCNYYEYQAHFLISHNRSYIVLAEDTESPCGIAMRMEVNADPYFAPPFAAGYYDTGNEKTLIEHNIDISQGSGYHFYYVGKLKIPEKGVVFLSRSWRIQLDTTRGELVGKEYDIWFSARFTGPRYMKGETGPDFVFVDRIILVEP